MLSLTSGLPTSTASTTSSATNINNNHHDSSRNNNAPSPTTNRARITTPSAIVTALALPDGVSSEDMRLWSSLSASSQSLVHQSYSNKLRSLRSSQGHTRPSHLFGRALNEYQSMMSSSSSSTTTTTSVTALQSISLRSQPPASLQQQQQYSIPDISFRGASIALFRSLTPGQQAAVSAECDRRAQEVLRDGREIANPVGFYRKILQLYVSCLNRCPTRNTSANTATNAKPTNTNHATTAQYTNTTSNTTNTNSYDYSSHNNHNSVRSNNLHNNTMSSSSSSSMTTKSLTSHNKNNSTNAQMQFTLSAGPLERQFWALPAEDQAAARDLCLRQAAQRSDVIRSPAAWCGKIVAGYLQQHQERQQRPQPHQQQPPQTPSTTATASNSTHVHPSLSFSGNNVNGITTNTTSHSSQQPPSQSSAPTPPSFELPGPQAAALARLPVRQQESIQQRCLAEAASVMQRGTVIRVPIGFYGTIVQKYLESSDDNSTSNNNNDSMMDDRSRSRGSSSIHKTGSNSNTVANAVSSSSSSTVSPLELYLDGGLAKRFATLTSEQRDDAEAWCAAEASKHTSSGRGIRHPNGFYMKNFRRWMRTLSFATDDSPHGTTSSLMPRDDVPSAASTTARVAVEPTPTTTRITSDATTTIATTLEALRRQLDESQTKLQSKTDECQELKEQTKELMQQLKSEKHERERVRKQLETVQQTMADLESGKDSDEVYKQKIQSLQDKQQADQEMLREMTGTFTKVSRELCLERQVRRDVEAELKVERDNNLHKSTEIQELTDELSERDRSQSSRILLPPSPGLHHKPPLSSYDSFPKTSTSVSSTSTSRTDCSPLLSAATWNDMDEHNERVQAELSFITASYGGLDLTMASRSVTRRLRLPLTDDDDESHCTDENSIGINLIVSLPVGYPVTAPLQVDVVVADHVDASSSAGDTLETTRVAAEACHEMKSVCQSEANNSVGSESVYFVLQAAEQWIATDWISMQAVEQQQLHADRCAELMESAEIDICRLLVSFQGEDHGAVEFVKETAGEYELGGWIKAGQPGFLLVEGLEDDCIQFLEMLVAHGSTVYSTVGKTTSIVEHLDQNRKLTKEFHAIEESKDGMNWIRKECLKVGLAQYLDR